VKKVATFCYVVGVFLLRKLNLISENFELGKQRKENLSLSDKSLEGRVSEVSSWSVRGRSAEGTILEEGMWCLADIELRSAKIKECDCLKKLV
jgi:hypothetical protein